MREGVVATFPLDSRPADVASSVKDALHCHIPSNWLDGNWGDENSFDKKKGSVRLKAQIIAAIEEALKTGVSEAGKEA